MTTQKAIEIVQDDRRAGNISDEQAQDAIEKIRGAKMYTYVARNKKEFERVCHLLITLDMKWRHKLNCSWNIEISY